MHCSMTGCSQGGRSSKIYRPTLQAGSLQRWRCSGGTYTSERDTQARQERRSRALVGDAGNEVGGGVQVGQERRGGRLARRYTGRA